MGNLQNLLLRNPLSDAEQEPDWVCLSIGMSVAWPPSVTAKSVFFPDQGIHSTFKTVCCKSKLGISKWAFLKSTPSHVPPKSPKENIEVELENSIA